MKRGFLEISFSWLFGIIAGAIILALAIFAVTRIINIGQSTTTAEAGSEVATLLNPLQTSFQSGQITSISLPVETRIYNQCEDMSGIFGQQILSLSQLSLGKWSAQSNGVTFENKYIFSSDISDGKQFYLFSKPVSFPFEISDVIYMTSSSVNYCFVDSPQSVQEELSNLNEGNIVLTNDLTNCSQKSIKVCFSEEDCDVNVNYPLGEVTKNGTVVEFYSDALMYGAIFSDNNVYECQLKRLMERGAELSKLYSEKSSELSSEGCSAGIGSDLIELNSMLNAYTNSSEMTNLVPFVIQVQNENEDTQCRLW
jgi:hypothetical protein